MDTFGVIGGGRGLKVGAQRPRLSGMHEVGPPHERSTFWVCTATVEMGNTHVVHEIRRLNTLKLDAKFHVRL